VSETYDFRICKSFNEEEYWSRMRDRLQSIALASFLSLIRNDAVNEQRLVAVHLHCVAARCSSASAVQQPVILSDAERRTSNIRGVWSAARSLGCMREKAVETQTRKRSPVGGSLQCSSFLQLKAPHGGNTPRGYWRSFAPHRSGWQALSALALGITT